MNIKKFGFTLTEVFLPCRKTKRSFGFTLAEVLITLGIIGVVVALVLPFVITNYQKQVVETKVRKFNSILNQAVKMSMVENGDPDTWVVRNKTYSYKENVDFLNTHIFPYIRYKNYSRCTVVPEGVCTTLHDGSMFSFRVDAGGGDIAYFLDGKRNINPRNKFQFQFTKNNGVFMGINSTHFIEPYIYAWNGTVQGLKNGNKYACTKNCGDCAYCTKLIQLNGWRIPKDYPW